MIPLFAPPKVILTVYNPKVGGKVKITNRTVGEEFIMEIRSENSFLEFEVPSRQEYEVRMTHPKYHPTRLDFGMVHEDFHATPIWTEAEIR